MSALVTTTSTINDSEHKSHALISYILLAIGLFTAIPLLVGAIWAMFTKTSALGTIYHSHLVNATRVFWWSLFWMIVGALLLVIGVGILVWGVIWAWALYRVINGVAKILADEPYPV